MKSIRSRLIALLTLHLAVAVILAGVIFWFWARHSILSQFDGNLMARAELVQSTVEEDDGHLEIEFNLTKLAGFKDGAAPVHFQIRSREGKALISSADFASLGIPGGLWEASGLPVFQSFHGAGDIPFRSLLVTFDAADDPNGDFAGLKLLIIRDSREAQASLPWLALAVSVAAAGSLGLLIFFLRRTLKRGFQPLEAFAARTGEIDVSLLPQSIALEEAPSELRPMVEKLNELLDRVHESLLRERRFTRDVAHELRTPVAELGSIAELAARWPDQVTPEAFAEVRDIASEMKELVSSLTLLNQLDACSVPLYPTEFAPLPILRQVIERLEPAIAARALVINLQPHAEAITWESDPALWKIAVSNLLENAVIYSPQGSAIEVALDGQMLRVSNPAPGLSRADADQMTDPFWRKDAARHDQSHSGLGLSLVTSIARRLQMRFSVVLGDNGILTCSLHRHVQI